MLKKRFLENFILSIFVFLGKRPRRFFFQIQIFNFLVRSILAKGFRFNESHSSKNRRRQYSRVCVWHTIKRDPDFQNKNGTMCNPFRMFVCVMRWYNVKEKEKKSRFFFLPSPHPLPKVLKWFDQVPDTRPNLAEILCVPTVSESSCRLSRTRFKIWETF